MNVDCHSFVECFFVDVAECLFVDSADNESTDLHESIFYIEDPGLCTKEDTDPAECFFADITECFFADYVFVDFADGLLGIARTASSGHFVKILFCGMDFHATLGFPGEGPGDWGLDIPQAAWARMRALEAEGGDTMGESAATALDSLAELEVHLGEAPALECALGVATALAPAAAPDTLLDDDDRSIFSCEGCIPDPDAAVTPDVDGAALCLQCPFCRPFCTPCAPRALMLHIGRAHAGEPIGAAARGYLQNLSRGICLTEGCGHLRIFGSPSCPRCRCRSAIRPLCDGDTVPLSAAAQAAESLPAVEVPVMNAIPESVPALGARPVLPLDFEARICRLSSITRLKIPPSCRLRLLEIEATNVEGANDGIMEFALLDEACAKLLLSKIPKGAHAAHEVKQRIALWDLGDFAKLLSRIEEQQRLAYTSFRWEANGRAHARALALRSVRNGAYRKGLQKSTSSVAVLSPAEQRAYAQQLLPDAGRQFLMVRCRYNQRHGDYDQ